jgi:hypothetical protein
LKHAPFKLEHVSLLLKLVLVLAGCKPDAGPPLSLISTTRVIALRGEPAEVVPGGSVTWDALTVSPLGEQAMALDWSICTTPRPLTTNDVVAPECLSSGTAIGSAPSVTTSVPSNTCQLFGPETPPSQGMPGTADPRPVAPDASGGWYQPYRADLQSAHNLGLERIRCNLAGASADVAAQFRMQYLINRNPQPNPLRINDAPADGQTITANQKITLTIDWPEPEHYPLFDVETQTLTDRRESMRVSWFTTAGEFSEERTGRSGDDPALDSDSQLTAPAGPLDVWAVARDDRGGVGWTHAHLEAR